jgi:hypothetical protein
MAGNPFHEAADDMLVGQRVRVRTAQADYEGWLAIREYNDTAVLLRDATRDGEHVGEVIVHDITAIERCESGPPVERVATEALTPSPYSQRSFETAGFRKYVRTVRQRGNLLSFPLVRPVDDGQFEIVSGHRRCHAARQAGIETLPVRVADLDDWAATRTFLDEHVPAGPDEAANAADTHSGFYEAAELDGL